MKKRKQRRYLIGGEYMSIPQIANQPWCPVTKYCLYQRIRGGMDIVEAITTKPHQTRKKYRYRGKMRSLLYLSRLPECIVKYNTLYERIERYGWPIEFAMTTPVVEPKERKSKKLRADIEWARPIEEIIKRGDTDDER
jgi:hypothetical protein